MRLPQATGDQSQSQCYEQDHDKDSGSRQFHKPVTAATVDATNQAFEMRLEGGVSDKMGEIWYFQMGKEVKADRTAVPPEIRFCKAGFAARTCGDYPT
jgi:predicted GNAT family acetyltransferase